MLIVIKFNQDNFSALKENDNQVKIILQLSISIINYYYYIIY